MNTKHKIIRSFLRMIPGDHGSYRHITAVRRMVWFSAVAAVALVGVLWMLANNQPEAGVIEPGVIPEAIDNTCDVLNVHDGDTLTLDCGINLDRRRILEKVRVHCIDAPELGQEPYGRWARDALKRMAGKAVAMKPVDRDRWGRVVARINHGGDIGLRMVAQGQAVVYGKYCTDRAYYEAEVMAKAAKLGVWKEAGLQQRPWEFRR